MICPPEFYQCFLDREFMFYSCADFNGTGCSLEEAQRNKAQHLYSLIAPRAGQTLMELGCGWGGMMRFIHQTVKGAVRLEGCTLSHRQADFAAAASSLAVSFTDFVTTNYPRQS